MSKETGRGVDMRRFKIIFVSFLLVVLFIFGTSCGTNRHPDPHRQARQMSIYGIPGITDAEIRAIQELREQHDYFVVGMLESTDAFVNEDGEVRGFSYLLSSWLTGLFEIPFIPQIFLWQEILDGLETGEIHFAGDLTPSEARRQVYYMTDPIAYRILRYFRLQDSLLPSEIKGQKNRLPRYALQDGTTVAREVMYYRYGEIEVVPFCEYDDAYELLRRGRADVIVTENVSGGYFDRYADIVSSDFFPLVFSPASFTTQTTKLYPIISALQKVIIHHSDFINNLYNEGFAEYRKHKFFMNLTEAEIEFIKNNPTIPFGAEFDNYPVSFYNVRNDAWEGICFDVIKEIEQLTGLNFFVVNDQTTEFHELLYMLEYGEIYILSELIPTPERQGRFVWPYNNFHVDQSIFISHVDHPIIDLNQIHTQVIGVQRGTAHEEFFMRWFPNHPNIVVYENQDVAFLALGNKGIDLVMSNFR